MSSMNMKGEPMFGMQLVAEPSGTGSNDPGAKNHYIVQQVPPPGVFRYNNTVLDNLEIKQISLADIMRKLTELDKKVDSLAECCLKTKQVVENLQQTNCAAKNQIPVVINRFDQEVSVEFPVENDSGLARLEELARTDVGAFVLRKKFDHLSAKSPYDLLRKAVGYLFCNTSRYTYSGRTAHNAKHEFPTLAASELQIIKILLETAMSKFHMDQQTATSELIKSINNFNDACTTRKKRKRE
ncbi:uncharacterized protein LOC128745723 [Sabethes cyaneus]|uniref:uncharacterized protein LOC128745723 n=1 Tax=Sabethes cyaneus TaxID=53552 RepID=UPI00237D80A2|nr:uncharacterized protein LOC128745723 [Sabethes cyaneus]XP_053698786.1 uncharacterized protein LOC128745723 [Sabethes cyaneus]